MLDPRRIGLNAADIGFQKRLHQDLDWGAIDKALQTDYNNQNSAIDVRRERETPKNEIHVMGGELAGFQSNDLLKTLARQQRQINGYPLRHFDAENPAIILPKKYGGFPMYNRNQVEYPELVSVFTEPMSAPLQRDTELLGRMGQAHLSNSLTTPFEAEGYINPMNQSYDALQGNKDTFIQRRHLQRMSDTSSHNRYADRGGGNQGIFINANGQPTTTTQDAVADALPQMNTFGTALNRHTARIDAINRRAPLNGGVAGNLQMGGGPRNPEDLAHISGGTPAPASFSIVSRDDATFVADVSSRAVAFMEQNDDRARNTPVITLTDNAYYNVPMVRGNSSMQAGELEAPVSRSLFGGGRRIGEEGTTPTTADYRKKTKAGAPYKKNAPGFKSWAKGGTNSAVKYKQMQDLIQLRAAMKSAERRKSTKRRRPEAAAAAATPSGLTPFSQRMVTMGREKMGIDYGAPINRSVATPGRSGGSRYG